MITKRNEEKIVILSLTKFNENDRNSNINNEKNKNESYPNKILE